MTNRVMENLTLNEALEDYYRQRLANKAENTRSHHEGQLELWRTWITRETQPNVYLADIDERHMSRYFDRLRPPQYAANTYNCYRQYLRAFWDYCRGEGWVRTNPMRHVDAARVPKVVRLLLSADELMRMLDGATPRDRVALAIGMNTALRSSDAAALTVGAVNLANDTLTAWIQKTQTEEVLPLTQELRAELILWFRHYALATGVASWQELPNAWTLFPSMHSHTRKGGGREAVYRIHTQYAHPEQIVHRALTRLGHPTFKEGFHTLRRSALRALFDLAAADGVGDPIRIPQALAGHKNRQTTEVYLGITHEKRLRDEMLRGKSFIGRAQQADAARHAEEAEGHVRAV